MNYLYLNGKNSVAVTYVEDDLMGDVVESVFINGNLHPFVDDENTNKIDYAEEAKRNMYKIILNNQFENLTVITGAGSSVGIGKTEKKGKVLTGLWNDSETILSKKKFDLLCELVGYNDKDQKGKIIKNLEKLLSLANTAKDYIKSDDIDIEQSVEKIKTIIKDRCTLELPDNSPHSLLLNKITKRKVTFPRIKVFTLNYDTLFEQAGKLANFTIIDGFSFSRPRIFSGRNFDLDIVSRNNSRVKEEDNFISKVFHLYKLHGSVDWSKEGDHIFQKENVDEALMIYPNQSKYESSYEQPYFEMMSRFQQSLRNENVLLISIGFSFGDKHIVTAIKEALEQNPSFQLMIVNKGIDTENDNLKPFIEAAKEHNNIIIVSETFEDFAKNYPDLKSYTQEDSNKIIINLNTSNNEPKSV